MFSEQETQQHLDELRKLMPKLWEMIAAVDTGMYRVAVVTGQCWVAPDGDHVLRLTLRTEEKTGLATTRNTEASAIYRVHQGQKAWSRLENLALVDLVCGGITRNFQVMDAVRKGQPIAPPSLQKLSESLAENVAQLQRINQELTQQIEALLAQRRQGMEVTNADSNNLPEIEVLLEHGRAVINRSKIVMLYFDGNPTEPVRKSELLGLAIEIQEFDRKNP